MQQVIDLIPFLDLAITGIVVFFMYVGWKQGLPRLLLTVGALYTGFLLASIYYHLFAVILANMLKISPDFTTDLIAFILLDAVVAGLMLALLINLFGHVEIKGRAMVFGKVGGMLTGLIAGAFTAAVLVTLMRAPVIANQTKQNAAATLPVVVVFGNSYDRSLIAPNMIKAAPFMLGTVAPLLPPGVKDRGAVPLLQSVAATK